jgi:hypothetical protein
MTVCRALGVAARMFACARPGCLPGTMAAERKQPMLSYLPSYTNRSLSCSAMNNASEYAT